MSEADRVAELAVKAAGVATIVKSDNGRVFLLVPQGYAHHDITLDHALDVLRPKAIAQGVTLQNADALVDYVKSFKSEASLLFADMQTSTIVAAIDYHAVDKPALVKHKATLSVPFSEEWKIWSGISGQLHPQLEFARFVEENAPDIKAPDAGTLLESVRDLQARRNVNFIKAVRTETDNESFEFTDSTEARTKGDIELPTKFLLNIPVYFGEPPGEVQAFLRWRLDESQLKLGIKLHRAEHIRQAAFKLIVTNVVERGGAPAIFGKLG
jgi:uncharacterized protein YfdQ (DUF2303 family)